MRLLVILLNLLCCRMCLYSQNLVPNHNFEEYISCPDSVSQLHLAFPWNGAVIFPYLNREPSGNRHSSDFLHICSKNVPPPFVAMSGDGCAAIITFHAKDQRTSAGREYAFVRLKKKLEQKKYVLWFSLLKHDEGTISSDAIDIHFSPNKIPILSTDFSKFKPQISNPKGNIFFEHKKWTTFKGSFLAKGGEEYMMIGNLREDEDVVFIESNNPAIKRHFSYYCLDDFYLYQCDRLIDLGPAEDTIFCNGSMDIGYYIPGAIYLWENGDTKAIRTISEAGTYWVEVRLDDCVTRDTIRLAVSDKRVPYTLGPDRYLCQGDTFWLKANAQQPIIWSTGSSHDSIPIFRPGIYWIQAMKNGCLVSDTIVVLPGDKPIRSLFLGRDTTLCSGRFITLGVVEVKGDSYLWQDGSTLRYNKATKKGWYIIKVTNQEGCTHKDSVFINFRDCLDFIPNVITPNGDDINDDFEIDGIQEDIWELRVLNRWGQTVFYSPDYRNNWGREAQPGLYYYHLRNLQHGDEHKGWLTVLKE